MTQAAGLISRSERAVKKAVKEAFSKYLEPEQLPVCQQILIHLSLELFCHVSSVINRFELEVLRGGVKAKARSASTRESAFLSWPRAVKVLVTHKLPASSVVINSFLMCTCLVYD